MVALRQKEIEKEENQRQKEWEEQEEAQCQKCQLQAGIKPTALYQR